MFDLKFASIDLRKAAYLEGIKVGRNHASYTSVSGESSYDAPQAIVTDDDHDHITICKEDLEYVHNQTWEDIKR